MLHAVLCLSLAAAVFPVSPSTAEECGLKNGVIGFRQPRSSGRGGGGSEGSSSKSRLVNGKETQKGAWPWQVSLQLLHPAFGFVGHWCAGVLIQPTWVLTAAHCIKNEQFSLPLAALWTAVLGDWNKDVEEHTEERIPIDEVIIHDMFHNYQNDIALMKLSRPTNITNTNVRCLCLPPTTNDTPIPKVCVTTGWGKIKPNGPLSSKLRQIKVPVHNTSVCRDKYGPAVPINEGHLCAGRMDGKGGGPCVGDSGGPLQCSGPNGRWFLAGLTSFGSGCAKPGYPDVYTKLSFHLPWILKQITFYTDQRK
ncbi:Serine proteases, trypsin family, serine active site,Peptidase S1, PA clan,Serine proteases, trypsin [Cinara cedri]|uniref:limulus clotting factor C n=1 Tax=Cinara cedri TaxID=506608 RepID=A0A5E4N7G1_9HEMI|nr:Serine proteases, trypsin family, serine active site,Peptidase S1, PA clan,Serine proteases, trypsin [Cinara cedri]